MSTGGNRRCSGRFLRLRDRCHWWQKREHGIINGKAVGALQEVYSCLCSDNSPAEGLAMRGLFALDGGNIGLLSLCDAIAKQLAAEAGQGQTTPLGGGWEHARAVKGEGELVRVVRRGILGGTVVVDQQVVTPH